MDEDSRVWGVWDPQPTVSPDDGLEWWHTIADAMQALRDRVNAGNVIPRCRVQLADGHVTDTARFYGNYGTRIGLFRVEGEPGENPVAEPEPYAALEFDADGEVVQREWTPEAQAVAGGRSWPTPVNVSPISKALAVLGRLMTAQQEVREARRILRTADMDLLTANAIMVEVDEIRDRLEALLVALYQKDIR